MTLETGFVRILMESKNADIETLTLGFLSADHCGFLRLPTHIPIRIEALTKSTLRIHQPVEPIPANTTDELLLPWLIELHRIRQMRNASDRLLNLLQVLVERFGRRTSDGFVMPWPLSHERLGEVISANRSTITRILNRWSERGQVVIDPTKRALWMAPQTMARS